MMQIKSPFGDLIFYLFIINTLLVVITSSVFGLTITKSPRYPKPSDQKTSFANFHSTN